MCRTHLLLVVGFALAALFLSVAGSAAVPAGPEKPAAPDQWEYCELHFEGGRAAAGFGKAAAAGAAVGQPAPVRPTALRLVTGEEEIESPSWEDLATKLKSPPAKASASANVHRLRVLNRLGSDGWELISHHKGTSIISPEAWTFRRKVAPKSAP